jgi:Flp pilus assembly protein TadG
MFAHRPKLFANERGAAIIELALVAPVLALMAIGLVDMSNAFSRKLALEQGAQRAIEKIMQTTELDTVEGTLKTEAVCQVNGTNADGTCKASPITTANVTVTYRLECSSGGAITSTQTNTDATTFDALTCNSGEKEARYIQVAVADKYTPMFPIHFLSYNSDGTYHVSATAGMRTE